jgi:hypothetical protein
LGVFTVPNVPFSSAFMSPGGFIRLTECGVSVSRLRLENPVPLFIDGKNGKNPTETSSDPGSLRGAVKGGVILDHRDGGRVDQFPGVLEHWFEGFAGAAGA